MMRRFLSGLLCCLLLMSGAARATDERLASTLDSLQAPQRELLYQYATLRHYAQAGDAAAFLQQHRHAMPSLPDSVLAQLSEELLQNSQLVYEVKKPSRIQALRGVFTTSRLLLGLAALVAAWSLIHLLLRYWGRIREALIRWFAPLFRILFSPRLLTWELLLLGLAGILFGYRIADTVIRTIVIHTGIYVCWAQLVALFTGRYIINRYLQKIEDTWRGGQAREILLELSLPALFTTAAMGWVMAHCADSWYGYEIVAPALIALCSPLMIYPIYTYASRVLLPVTNTSREDYRRLSATTLVVLLMWMALVYAPVLLPAPLTALSVVLVCLLVVLSLDKISNGPRWVYIYIQAFTLAWLAACMLAGTQLGLSLLSRIALGGLVIYIICKYWEVPVLFGWSWRNRKSWGTLGMALLLWLIAAIIRWKPEWFVLF
ncbi:hypothetical protein [Chitinophaga vietnamensis]|uniref:hypothetical protein n=1 Tax=Chitinophaga vietnamensis TaxID=2593957 RepID=UPI00117891BD|nr:hypothetical protein [Chitinophaga vietnamensis]